MRSDHARQTASVERCSTAKRRMRVGCLGSGVSAHDSTEQIGFAVCLRGAAGRSLGGSLPLGRREDARGIPRTGAAAVEAVQHAERLGTPSPVVGAAHPLDDERSVVTQQEPPVRAARIRATNQPLVLRAPNQYRPCLAHKYPAATHRPGAWQPVSYLPDAVGCGAAATTYSRMETACLPAGVVAASGQLAAPAFGQNREVPQFSLGLSAWNATLFLNLMARCALHDMSGRTGQVTWCNNIFRTLVTVASYHERKRHG